MIEEYNDDKLYQHEETCTYDGKIWRASCYVGGMTGLSPKDGEGSFWIEDDVSVEITINDVYEGETEFDQSFMMTKAEFGNVTVTSGSDPEIK
jgi:hypothetical protein